MRFLDATMPGVCGVLLVVGLAGPVAAFDPSGSDVADALMKTLEATGADSVTYESVTDGAGGTTIAGLTTTRTNDGETNTITTEKVEIKGGAVTADGGFSADDLVVTNMTMTQSGEEAELSAVTASVKGLVLPPAEAIEAGTAIGSSATYGSFVVDKLMISEPGKPAVTVGRLETTVLARDGDGVPSSGELRVSEVRIPAGAFGEEDEGASELKALGYEEVELDIYGKGGWDAATGNSSLEELRFDADDMGKITLQLALGGVTQEVIDGLQQEEQDFNQMLGLLNNVTIETLSLSYEDDGLADRMIARNAEQQGVDKQEFVDEITGALPMMLGMLQNPAFEQSIVDAVSSFLSAPGSITVAAAPGSPVPVAQIVGVAMMAPQTIPSVLSLTISANE